MENEWWHNFNILNDKLFNTLDCLSDDEVLKISKEIELISEKIKIYQDSLLRLGQILDLNELKKNGYSTDILREFYNEDNLAIDRAKLHLKIQELEDRDYMFGYPANMVAGSSVVKYLRWIESQLFYVNECGTAYNSGNYRMSQKELELEIITKIIKNLNLDVDEYWGYITTGGTEGNLWGIREGFSRFPSGKLFFSEDAHYSALKGANFLPNTNYEVIPSCSGVIDKEKLLEKIIEYNDETKNGIILLLTYGTTTYGSVDDIEWIKNKLDESKIEHYIHLDAALYGGIPSNQVDSPSIHLGDIMKMDIDSISISLHKYVGVPKTNGVLLAKSKINSNFVEYIGQCDVTLCGSRDFLPHTTLQMIKELYDRNTGLEYSSNIKYFERLMVENSIGFDKGTDDGNIFVINRPSDYICYKYQLATFNYDGEELAHIIIFPFHKKEIIRELVLDIAKEMNEKKFKVRKL